MPGASDPILVEVIRNELAAISEEMALATARTSRSAHSKLGDLTTAITDAHGRPLGVGEGSGLFIFFSLASGLVKRIRAQYGDAISPGDVFMVNDPYSGGSHMPDIWVAAPQFCNSVLAAFALCYTHHMDIGGRFPGGQSGQCSETYEEGIRIPIVKAIDKGKVNMTLLDVLTANVRNSEDFRGDIQAKFTGCWRAQQSFDALFDRYGLDNFVACFDRIHAYTGEVARRAITSMSSGAFSAELQLPDDGFGRMDPDLRIRVMLTVTSDRLIFDFTGSSKQAPGAVNLPAENTKGVVYAACRRLLFSAVPLNSGMMEPIEIVLPPGSVINPRFPAAVGARAITMFLLEDLMHRVLAKAVPGRIPVPCERWDLLIFQSRRPDSAASIIMDAFPGGWGARPTSDGPDGISQSGISDVPVEMMELDQTLVVEKIALVPDSAGAGQYRGSQAISKMVRYLQPGHLQIRTNKLVPTPGMEGGHAGMASANVLFQGEKSITLPAKNFLDLQVSPGDRIEHRVNGCGGFGDPFTRNPDKVLRDVLEERLTVAVAAEQYGVVIDPNSLTVDGVATAALRDRDARRELVSSRS